MDRSLIEQLITKHEGRRNKVYKDQFGILTDGIGWNLEDPQSQDICDHFGLNLELLKEGLQILTDEQIDSIFSYQLTQAISDCCSMLPTFPTMPDNVQMAVTDMMFQLGLTRFRKFYQTIGALNSGNWKQAAIYAKDSLWAKQTPARAADDIALMESA